MRSIRAFRSLQKVTGMKSYHGPFGVNLFQSFIKISLKYLLAHDIFNIPVLLDSCDCGYDCETCYVLNVSDSCRRALHARLEFQCHRRNHETTEQTRHKDRHHHRSHCHRHLLMTLFDNCSCCHRPVQ